MTTGTLERSGVDDATLDRIDVRYSVHAHFEFNEGRSDFFVATADLSITCGVYSVLPDRACMAGLVMNRCVHEDDLDLTGTGLSRREVADMINERGVRPGDIRAMRIEDVIVDDAVVASTMED